MNRGPIALWQLYYVIAYRSSLLSFDLNLYMLRKLHSIVSLVLFVCCVFCISILYVPFVLFNFLCDLCILSVNLVIVVPSIYVLFKVLLFVIEEGLVTETFTQNLSFISCYHPNVVHFWSSLTFYHSYTKIGL